MRINGWKRIGIIVSIVWILGAGLYTFDSEIDKAIEEISSIHVQCDANLAGKPGDAWETGFNACNKQSDDSVALAYNNAWLTAAIVAFVPVPPGWGFVYLVIFLIGWVRRGFNVVPREITNNER
jgi:hypothetical protein